jgi:hypothetical protein
MDLIVEKPDGQRIEYHHTERSKFVIEFAENLKIDTAIYYPEDFTRIEVKRPGECAAPGTTKIDDLIDVIDRTITASKTYEERHLREYYTRDMAAIRSMLAEMKGQSGNGVKNIKGKRRYSDAQQ